MSTGGAEDWQSSDHENNGDKDSATNPNAMGATMRPVYNVYAGRFDGPSDEHDLRPNGQADIK